MRNRRGMRRGAAIVGLLLALVFATGALRAAIVGDAEWWNLIILLPVAAIAYQLYRRWLKPSRAR